MREGFPLLAEYPHLDSLLSVVDFVRIHVHRKVLELVKQILINIAK